MIKYFIRRIAYAIPLLLSVNLITFLLFFAINSPDDMARLQLGEKHISQAQIEDWKKNHHYDLPLFFNPQGQGIQHITETIFYQKSIKLFSFDFGVSDAGRSISLDIKQRMWPSLYIALPSLILGVFLNISCALLIVYFRTTYIEKIGLIASILLMSISPLFYIILGQYFFAKTWQLLPISGYVTGVDAWHFLLLPIIVAVISGVGTGIRWYRTIFLEELGKDYVKTARAKGASELYVLFKHILPNGMLPILTGLVVIIPSLFLGSLLLESFFGIPGLGSYMIDAIGQQDFAIVRSMVFLGAVLYVLGLILTDISYALADPRIRLAS